jgi:uncharacterized protein
MELEHICKNSRILESMRFIQHGKTSVYHHSVSVAYYSYLIALKLRLPIHERTLIRGALLHDYFLYDWHIDGHLHRLHGFRHPRKALVNAMKEFQLSQVEKDIIIKHMFPLTPVPPMHLEGWIVCFVDKVCSTKETTNGIIGRIKDIIIE